MAVLAVLTSYGCPRNIHPPPPPPPPVQHFVAMQWDNVGDDQYIVLRGDSEAVMDPIGTTGETHYKDLTVQGGTNYYYGVKGKDTEGHTSELSNVVVASVPK